MKIYKVLIDRPIGYLHHGQTYLVNYGYIPEIIAGDGQGQDVYVLSDLPESQKPLSEFTGKLIAIIHRKNDVEDKWVLTSKHEYFDQQEIAKRTHFMEQYFETEIEMI